MSLLKYLIHVVLLHKAMLHCRVTSLFMNVQADGQLDPDLTSQLQQLQQQLKGLMASASHGGDLQDEMDDVQAAGEDSAKSASHALVKRQMQQRLRQLNAQVSIQSRDRDRRFHGPKPKSTIKQQEMMMILYLSAIVAASFTRTLPA